MQKKSRRTLIGGCEGQVVGASCVALLADILLAPLFHFVCCLTDAWQVASGPRRSWRWQWGCLRHGADAIGLCAGREEAAGWVTDYGEYPLFRGEPMVNPKAWRQCDKLYPLFLEGP